MYMTLQDAKCYHLFISHSWTRHDQYSNLRQLLEQVPNFKWQDRSIPKDDPVHSGSDKELVAAIKNQMQSCGIVLVLVGVYASYSKWIDKEIRIARSSFKKPKPVLAIIPYGNERISDTQYRADLVVSWNTKSIVSAIKDLA